MRRYRDLYRRLDRVEQKLDNLLLYLDFFPNVHGLPAILMKDGAVVVLFRLAGIDYEGLGEAEKEQFSYYARTALEQLPDDGRGFMLTNLLLREPAHLQPLAPGQTTNPVLQFLQAQKQAFWSDQARRSYQNQVVGALRYFDPDGVAPAWSTLVSDGKAFDFVQEQIAARIAKLYQGWLALRTAGERFGFAPLDAPATFTTLYRLINRRAAPAYRPDLSLNVQLAQSGFLFTKENHLRLNDREFAAVIGLKYPPAGTVALYLRRFYELDFPFVLTQSLGFPDKRKLWKKMDFYKNIAHSLAAVDKTSGLYVSEVADFQRRVESDKELPVWWSCALAVYAPSPDVLRERVMKVQNLFREIGAAGLPEGTNFRNGYFAMFPGHERFYLRRSLITSANAGDLLSAYTLYGGDPAPLEYFQDRLQGVFSFHPFTPREKAHHLCITGPTGSGKSFFVNKLLMSALVTRPVMYVIDLKRSFAEFFDFLRDEMPDETAVWQVARDRADCRFNPFLLADLEAPVPDAQLAFCLGLLKVMIGRELDAHTEWSVRQGLSLFFEKYRVLLRHRADGRPVPPLSLLANTLERKAARGGIADAVRLWTVGRKGAIFDSGRDTLRLARYCYFDLADWESDEALMTALVYAIFAKIHGDITAEAHRAVPKYLFCDEAHLYLRRSPEMAAWLELLCRTGRHHHLLVGIVTQSIKDLVGEENPWSKGIVENIRQAFFFNGQKGIDDAFHVFQMSDYHRQQYYRLRPEHHEFLYWSSGGLRRILRPVTDAATYWLATTDPQERDLRRRVRERCGGDVRRTVETCVRETAGATSRPERLQALAAWLDRQAPLAQPTENEPIYATEGL